MNYKHISTAVEETLQYIDDRRKGKQQPLYISKNKLNKAIDGFGWGRIYSLAGQSGSGKSLTLEEIKRDLVDYNSSEAFEILSFEFEMLAMDQISRNISSKINKTTKELYSANKEWLNDSVFNQVSKTVERLKNYPIYYVDTVGSVKDIEDTISFFVKERQLKENNKGLVVTLDHSLLVKGINNQKEKEIVDSLMHLFVELKQKYTSKGLKIMFILLSQLNRDIESQERIINPLFHYPKKSDIFAASSVYYCSDVVIVLHKPAIIEGLGKFYGPPRTGYKLGLPVFTDDGKAMLYWHIIKSRFGENQILMMIDDFANSRVLEYSSKQLNNE